MPDGRTFVVEQHGAACLPAELHDVVVERSGRRLIDSLSLALTPTGVTVLLGPNGAGKSLTLRLLAGLISPDGGTVSVAGKAADGTGTAMVFQKPVLLRRSVSANLRHAISTYGIPRHRRRERLDELLALGQLGELATIPARLLSGGEQQRVAMVRAMAAEPSLLLLDEPTASLDPQSTSRIEALIGRAVTDGVKVVLVTHDRHQAERVADDIAFLNRGQVVEQAPASQFFQSPSSPDAKAYLEGRLLL